MQKQNESKQQSTANSNFIPDQIIKHENDGWFKIQLKKLNHSLQGVQINRIVQPSEDKKKEYIKHIESLANFFSDKYSQEINKKYEKENFYKLFTHRTQSLITQNENNKNLILEAVLIDNKKILGTVHFRKIDNGNEILASSFSADNYNSAHGIGTQLMVAMLEIWPEVQAIHGLVRRENKRAIEIYKHWGFKESNYGDPKVKASADAIGMTLSGEALEHFKKKYNVIKIDDKPNIKCRSNL